MYDPSNIQDSIADFTIKALKTEQEYLEAFPVINELRTYLNEKSYLELLDKMTKDGYQLYALYNNQTIVAVAGIAFRANFYYGDHIFVYDLVTRHSHRSKGYGKKLLSYSHELAKENKCQIIALESGLQRVDAHRFYESRLGYEKFCYSFKKVLEQGK